MTDEFCLSDKRERDYADMTEDFYLYSEENVKEFIKKLKEVFESNCKGVPPIMTYGELIIELDKLAGEVLI